MKRKPFSNYTAAVLAHFNILLTDYKKERKAALKSYDKHKDLHVAFNQRQRRNENALFRCHPEQ